MVGWPIAPTVLPTIASKRRINRLGKGSDTCGASSPATRRNDFSRCMRSPIIYSLGRHLLRAANYRLLRARSFSIWQTATETRRPALSSGYLETRPSATRPKLTMPGLEYIGPHRAGPMVRVLKEPEAARSAPKLFNALCAGGNPNVRGRDANQEQRIVARRGRVLSRSPKNSPWPLASSPTAGVSIRAWLVVPPLQISVSFTLVTGPRAN